MENSKTQTAILGAGCFWCIEAVLQRVKGVEKVEPGYIGGQNANPTYKEICTGQTGHAEVAKVTFDTSVLSFEELLEVFWKTHDPTTLNRQGNDVGTQYRSAIFYNDIQQKEIAEAYKKQLDESRIFANPIVTEITAATEFYVAEDYHHNYYNQNASQPYCQFVVRPKVEKLKKHFADKLK